MKKVIIPILTCIVLIMNLFIPAQDASALYSGASSWAVPELDRADGYGLIIDRVKSNVSANITREEFAETAVRFYEVYTGNKAEAGNVSFSDTTNTEVLKAANLGLVQGVGEGKFAPGQLVTRAEMATILLRVLMVINPSADFSTAGAVKFADDNEIESWAANGVYYCSEAGIIKGTGAGRFEPDGISTREAAIIVCTRAYELYKNIKTDTPPANTQTPSTGLSNSGDRISAGENYSMAILDDNTLWGWGVDNGVHLGLRFSGKEVVSEPSKIMDNVKSVFAGWGTTLAIKTDNSLWAWGDNMPGVGEERITFALKPEKIMDNVISAACGYWFVLAVKSDGSLWAWGNNREVIFNESKKSKDNKSGFFRTPVVKPMKVADGVSKVTAEVNSYCVLKKDGTLLHYGAGVSGNRSVKINGIEFDILSTGVKDMSMTSETVYFTKKDDSLWGIGKKAYEAADMSRYNTNKENSYDYTPLKIMDGVKAADVSSGFGPIALKKDGKLVAWNVQAVIDSTFDKKTPDLNSFSKSKTIELLDGVREIDAGTYQYIVTKNDGTVWMWGINGYEDTGGATDSSTMGSTRFVRLDFSQTAGRLFTDGDQPDKLLSDWIRDKTASGEMPAYDAGFKANWNVGYWEESGFEMKGFHTVQSGNTVYGYDVWNTLCLVGTIDGNRLKGFITDGIFEIRMNPGNQSYAGLTYLNSASEPAVWKGTK